MRYLVLLLALLIGRSTYATACNSECTFKRGDVNCSGAVNQQDVVDFYYLNIANHDAADFDDDGTVEYGQDFAALNAYVNSGGAAPACPGPTTLGLDCTPDALENCCSPPTTANDLLDHFGCIGVASNTSWDGATADEFEDGFTCTGQTLFYNNYDHSCSQPSSSGEASVVDITVGDAPGFTRKRLQKGVQEAYLQLAIDAWFDNGIVCDDDNCTHANDFYVDIVPDYFEIVIKAWPKTGGFLLPITITNLDATLNYDFRKDAPGEECIVISGSDTHQTYSPRINITNQLATLPSSDCDVWEIVEIEATHVGVDFDRGGVGRVATFETVEVWVSAWVEYEWCECE